MLFENMFDGRDFCVYGHYLGDQLILVGAGKISAAFRKPNGTHLFRWNEMKAKGPITVRIFERFFTEKEARRYEYSLLLRRAVDAAPSAVPKPSRRQARETDILAVNAQLGLQNRYESIRAAHEATGISLGAISSSITKRHPIVRGWRFHRVPLLSDDR